MKRKNMKDGEINLLSLLIYMETDFTFSHKLGRPKKLTDSEAYEAKLKAKRKWRRKNSSRVSAYNELYRDKHSKKSKKRSHLSPSTVKKIKKHKHNEINNVIRL